MTWIIELFGDGIPTFVESFSNKLCCPRCCHSEGKAKPFSTEDEAKVWAKAYIPGFNYVVRQRSY